MKKNSASRLAWLSAFVVLLLAAVLPLTAFADAGAGNEVYENSADTNYGAMPQAENQAAETINVTFTFDASVVAEDMGQLYNDMKAAGLLTDETMLPGEITVQVPKGSTVKEALEAAKAQAPFSEVGLDNGYVTQIGFVGSEPLTKLVNMPVGVYSSGNIFYCAGWGYSISDWTAFYQGMSSDVLTSDCRIAFKYGLCVDFVGENFDKVEYDQQFIAAYNTLKAVFEQAGSAGASEELTAAKANAKYLLDDIAAKAKPSAIAAAGNNLVWASFFAQAGDNLAGGYNSWISQVQNAATALGKAAGITLDNDLTELTITVEGSENKIDFSSKTYNYVVKELSSPASVTYTAAAPDNATVTVTLNGADATANPIALTWTDICNTLTFSFTPSASSGLQPTTYTVKLYRAISDAERLEQVKEQGLLTWDTIRELNFDAAQVTTELNLPTTLRLADGLGEVGVSWTTSNADVVATSGQVTRPAQDTAVTLTATLTAGSATETKVFEVTVPTVTSTEVKLAQMNTLMNNISAGYTGYTGSADDWKLLDLAAYAKLNPTTANKTTAAARQAYINTVIAAVANDNASESTLAKAILILQSIGADPTNLYPVNSNTPISAVGKLAALEKHDPVSYVGSYTLLALNQGDYQTEAIEQALVAEILKNQGADGAWTEWGASNNSTASMLIALSNYADDPAVRAAIDKGVAYLAESQLADGTWRYDSQYGSNATSCAAIIKALAALGINPDTDSRFVKDGGSALDGLLKFALADNSGFGYTDNKTADPYTTPEAFQALVAAVQVMNTQQAYNVYDFSANTVAPARATGSAEGGSGGVKPDPGAGNVKVTIAIKADTGYWLRMKTVTVPQGTSVMDAFLKAIEGTGIIQQGAEDGYVSSMTKDGRTLGEFDGGPNSGWQYKVDGELPTIGMDEYALDGGEDVVIFFTEDWTTEPGSSGFGGGGGSASDGSAVLTPNAVVNGDKASTAVTAKDVDKVIAQAEKAGADTVVIEPELSGKAAEIVVSLPTEAAQKLAGEKLNVTMNTACGNLTLPNLALEALAKQAGGADIRLTIEKLPENITETKSDNKAGDIASNSAAQQALAAAGGKVASVAEVKLVSDNKELTSFGGHEITVEIPVEGDAFKTQQEYKVVVISADGQVETLVGRCLRVGGKTVVQVRVSHLSTFIVTTAAVGEAKPLFADVPADSWFAGAVEFVQQAGLMKGETETLFNPNGKLNRAMLVTILYRLEQQPAVGQGKEFSDVAPASWYGKAVAWASAEGIVNGYEDGSFRPEASITREELAAVLYRYEQLQGGGFTGAWAFKLDYADADKVAEWAYEAVCWTTMNGILQGDEAKRLNPQGSATRAEAAAILMRFCEGQAK